MKSVRRHIWLSAPAEKVWDVVGDAGGVSRWFPSVEQSSLEGSIRHVTLTNGLEVTEEIVTCDNETRRLQYRVVSGLPTTFHLATLDVIEVDDAHSLVVSGVNVEPDEFAPRLASSVETAFQLLKSIVE
jgi:uncharacterized protein YndB with AHSA1/START domain